MVYFSTAVSSSELYKFSVPNLYAFVWVYLFISECLISSIYLHLPISPYIYTCLYTYSVCMYFPRLVYISRQLWRDFFFPQNSCKLVYHHGFRSLTNLVRTLILSKKTTIFIFSKHVTKGTQILSNVLKEQLTSPVGNNAGGETSPRWVRESWIWTVKQTFILRFHCFRNVLASCLIFSRQDLLMLSGGGRVCAMEERNSQRYCVQLSW